jgi:hypothetical protein
LEKEIALERVREEFHLLDAEFQKANEKRDATFKKLLDAELETAAGELFGLNEAFATAKVNKDAYDTTEQKLKDERAAMDTDGSEQATKDAKDGELDAHKGTKTGIYDAFDNAKQAKEDKQGLIDGAAEQRDIDAYNKEKQERDAAFFDLEGLKMDEEGQRDAFQGDVDFWKGEILIAIANDDDTYFLEANKFREEALKNVEKAQAKLDATEALFEVEKAGKEKRDFDEAVKAATAVFEEG